MIRPFNEKISFEKKETKEKVNADPSCRAGMKESLFTCKKLAEVLWKKTRISRGEKGKNGSQKSCRGVCPGRG